MLKKLSFFVIAVVFIFGYSTASMAAWSGAAADLSVNGTTVTLSNGVHGDYKANSSGSSYSAATYNDKGTKAYGVAANVGSIKYIKCTNDDCGTNAPTDPVNNGDSGDISGWSNL